MVAHVEEAHALLDEFEVGDENNTVPVYPPASCSIYGRQSLYWVKWPCSARLIASLMTIVLCAFGAVFTLYGARTSPPVGGEMKHLGYFLNPQKHASRPPTTLVFNWTVTSGLRSPDGVQKQVYLVNEQFPGPIIEARSGDRIVVQVQNGLADEDVSLHWHGLRLKHQNAMDGAVGFTQTAIQPLNTFIYNFTVGDDEYGTFWWHSHSDLQRADGLWGGLVVHAPDEYPAEGDYLIMVGDWFHRNQTEVLSWYADASSRGNEPVPDSLLVNGRGRFNCSMAVPARPVACSQVAIHGFEPLLKSVTGKSTKLRVVNTGSVAGFTVGVTGATVRPVRIDGGFDVRSESTQTASILYPGQRVDLDIEWDHSHLATRQMVIYMDEE
ncbi:putative multicopper oxidase [Fusarium longipes]|uniref:Putative multicopper oxidase n=1 Tax=Fusarium longipes TaxID=694270 RepID=A0A395SYG8_9HYPO|nr:putative multicopper oxidase [Fusarium longipes]